MIDYELTQCLNTIPLKGSSMTRDENGKKVVDGSSDIILPKWRDKTKHNFSPKSEEETPPLLAAIIDRDLVFIDFDVKEWFEEALMIDAKQDKQAGYIAKSDKGDGHIGYRVPRQLAYNTLNLTKAEISEGLNDGQYTKTLDILLGGGLKGKIDIQYGGKKLIFLASSGNKTKELISDVDELGSFTDLPLEMIRYIQSLMFINGTTERIIEYKPDDNGMWGDLTDGFVKDPNYHKQFFQNVTPNKWRSKVEPDMHPSNLDEKPNDYLYAFATKLGSDASVSEEVFQAAMLKINSLCSPAKDVNDLMTQIVEPIMSGSARINDEPIWRYNPKWKTSTLNLVNRTNKDTYNVYYDERTDMYLLVNLSKQTYMLKQLANLRTISATFLGKKTSDIETKVKAIRMEHNPKTAYGVRTDAYGTNIFNSFQRSEQSLLMCDPEACGNIKYPDVEKFLRFLDIFFSSEKKKEYWLRWMKTRLLTYEHSPVVWSFDGVPRSGKGILTNVMSNLLGAIEDTTVKVTMNAELIGDKFNGYLETSEIILVDELKDMDPRQIKSLSQIIKTVSGDDGRVTIRPMRGEAYSSETRATFVLNSNDAVRLFDEVGQSRLFYNLSREKLFNNFEKKEADKWNKSKEFSFQLAAYLGQEVHRLTPEEYVDVPEWVYDGDNDIKEYRQVTVSKEKQLEEALYNKDVQALMQIYGVSSWKDIPHVEMRKGKRSGVLIQVYDRYKKLYPPALDEISEDMLNWKEVRRQLMRQPDDYRPKKHKHYNYIEFDVLPECNVEEPQYQDKGQLLD